MKIALAQVLSTSDPEQNLAIVKNYAKRAKAAGASLVVFPEAMQVAFGNDLVQFAEDLDDYFSLMIRRYSTDIDIAIIVGIFTPGEGQRVRNTLLATGPDDEAYYDKIHLFDAFGYAESDSVTRGVAANQFEHEGHKLGLATCYDLRFPQLFIANANAGASVNILCASWGAGEGKVHQWTTLAQARALDSTTFVVAVDQADPLSVGQEVTGTDPLGVGHSMVVDPLGRVIAQAGAAPELLVVDLDLALVDQARKQLPVLKNTVDF